MNYCPHCGAKVNEDQDVCLSCGKQLKQHQTLNIEDDGGFAWSLLGFFVPLLGLILGLIWKADRPNTSHALIKGAIIGIVLPFVLVLIITIIAVIVGLSGGMYYY